MAKLKDHNQDGVADAADAEIQRTLVEITTTERKQAAQRKMAWSAVISMAIFTVLLFTPMVSIARVEALGELLGLFYIAQASIVGAYMGMTAWLDRDK